MGLLWMLSGCLFEINPMFYPILHYRHWFVYFSVPRKFDRAVCRKCYSIFDEVQPYDAPTLEGKPLHGRASICPLEGLVVAVLHHHI